MFIIAEKNEIKSSADSMYNSYIKEYLRKSNVLKRKCYFMVYIDALQRNVLTL